MFTELKELALDQKYQGLPTQITDLVKGVFQEGKAGRRRPQHFAYCILSIIKDRKTNEANFPEKIAAFFIGKESEVDKNKIPDLVQSLLALGQRQAA